MVTWKRMLICLFICALVSTAVFSACGKPAATPEAKPTTPVAPSAPSQKSMGTPTMTVTPILLLSGKVGTSYSQTLTVSGGTSPYTWSISAGSLPDGISLGSSTSTTNIIKGTPTKAGPFSFSIKITDSKGGPVTLLNSITITQLNMTPKVVTLETRPGVTVKVLLLNPSSSRKGTLVLFPGGLGSGEFLEQSGTVSLGINFVVRSSGLFVDQGFAVAIVDVPSDQEKGMALPFRITSEHAQDINKIIDFLSQSQMGPIFLVGTSASSLSVAYLGASLGGDRIGGIVLTSSITSTDRGSIFDLPLGLNTITLPVLIVHHQQDGCHNTKFSDALRLRDQFTKSLRAGFVEVLGGNPPLSGPCDALSYHGFLGREREVVLAITDWVTGKKVSDKVGAP